MNSKGFAAIAALVGTLILGAVGVGMAYLITSGQQTTIHQVTGDQAFYSTQAGMEFALRKVIAESSPEMTFSPKFSGETLTIIRDGSNINISSPKSKAFAQHSIADPGSVSPVGCLQIDTSGAYIQGTTYLMGGVLRRDPSCTQPLTVTALSGTSWLPNTGQVVNQVTLNGVIRFAGAVPSGGDIPLSPALTIANNANYPLNSIRWNSSVVNTNFHLILSYTYQGSPYIAAADVKFLADDQAGCFVWGTAGAINAFSSGWVRLNGTTVTNTCDKPIRLNNMTINLIPANPPRNLITLRINGADRYSGSAPTGALFAVDYVIPASTTYNVDYFTFDPEIFGRNYSINWGFADGSSVNTDLGLFASAQNTCLNIDTSAVYLSTTTRIAGIKLENTCGADIGIVSMSVSWTGDAARRLTAVQVDDARASNISFTGSYASGATLDFAALDLYYTDGLAVKDLDHLQFNNNVVPGSQYTLTFNMVDGTSKSVTFVVNTNATCLTIGTGSVSLSNGGRDLVGMTISNSCANNITWITTVVSWTPTTPNRRLQQIVVNGVTVLTGASLNSGSTANNGDVVIGPSQTLPINRFRFNSTMSGRTITVRFNMLDGTNKSTPAMPF